MGLEAKSPPRQIFASTKEKKLTPLLLITAQNEVREEGNSSGTYFLTHT
jgi:hypothetical protein